MPTAIAKERGFLNTVERLGNKMPNVTILFIYALVICWIVSFVLSFVNFDYYHPSTGEQIKVLNMFNYHEIIDFLIKSVNNFMSFPPLGITIVATFGIGIAEKSGFINTALKRSLTYIPDRFLTPAVVVISVAAHVVSDSAYVVLMPVAALMFYAKNKHPLAGISSAFAGLAGGFSANFVPSKIDPIMQGFTQQAARIIVADYDVNVLCNYFLSAGSTIGVVVVCWLITEKIVEPWLNKNCPVTTKPDNADHTKLNAKEQQAFKWAMLSIIGLVILLVVLLIPESSPLRAPEDGSLTSSKAPIMQIIVPLILLFFALPGIVYGYKAESFKSLQDITKAMEEITKSLIPFIVFAFFAAQFLYSFSHSQLGVLLALSGASLLTNLALPPQISILIIIGLVGIVNLFITSATSKWAIMAPVLVPMLMAVGISPELTQAAFRISDSAINVCTPMFPFYPLIIMYCRQYYPETGVGTLCSMMIPYSIGLLIILTATLFLFWGLNIPLGFDSSYIIPVSEKMIP